MAAMASPLLEAGAIDGAKGILINITGSSSLKLSEVNEASSIIQGAAHEDANIIFGAVLDETMGDELKITVIATGFRQQEMPERRERMLAETTMPGSRWDAPIAPRVQVTRPAVPATGAGMIAAAREQVVGREAVVAKDSAVAREPEPVRGMDARAAEVRPATVAVAAPPVATPVTAAPAVAPPIEASLYRAPVESPAKVPQRAEPATVFDDDFFRTTRPAEAAEPRAGEWGGERRGEGQNLSGMRNVQSESPRTDVFHVQAASAPMQATADVGSSYPSDAGSGEPDELDIPAFLRRGH